MSTSGMLSVAQTATILGISPGQVRRMLADKRLRGVKYPGPNGSVNGAGAWHVYPASVRALAPGLSVVGRVPVSRDAEQEAQAVAARLGIPGPLGLGVE